METPTTTDIPVPVPIIITLPVPEPSTIVLVAVDLADTCLFQHRCGIVAESFSPIRSWRIAARVRALLTASSAPHTVADRTVVVGYNAQMNATPDALSFFSVRARTYVRFIRLFRYQRGLQKYLEGSTLLRSGIRVLDAGCGTGAALIALHDAMLTRGLAPAALHGFDLTPAMLDCLRESLRVRNIVGVELVNANVLSLGTLPTIWRDYDLIVTASMLEYVPRAEFAHTLNSLRSLIRPGGSLLLFMTRDNWLMRPLIGQLWQSNLYSAQQLRAWGQN